MLELLSPAGSSEALIAAVQSGADIVHIGNGLTAPEREAGGFTPEGLVSALHYCRARSCRAVLSLGDLYTDASLKVALDRAIFAAENGIDAIFVQDLGLARTLRSLLPDMPLWGDVRLGIHNTEGALAAAAVGLSRVTLAPELTLGEIEVICRNSPVETMVYAHGHLCFARAGQCYLSALRDRNCSASRSLCADPCREAFDLGGRMDSLPMSTRDLCLLEHLEELEKAGVNCVGIEGHGKPCAYVARVTDIYSRAVREGLRPSAEERQTLEDVFSTNGLTDTCLTGENPETLYGETREPPRGSRRVLSQTRKQYMKKERRRIPLKFYVVMRPNEQALFAAEDSRGNRAVHRGIVPVDLGRTGLSEAKVKDILYRTGGTPYTCAEVQCQISPRMDYPEAYIEEARDSLLRQITEAGKVTPVRKVAAMPPMPEARIPTERLKYICQIRSAEQLSEALARTDPDYLYVPAELIAAREPKLNWFRDRGCKLVGVLPPLATDSEMATVTEMMAAAKAQGVKEFLAGSLSYVRSAATLGVRLRGDYGLNLSNSRALELLRQANFLSATASFELSLKEVRTLVKPLDTEMLAYGRLPALLTDHCMIQRSAGRCDCARPGQLQDGQGGLYPILREFGCRNQIVDCRKLYLADKKEALLSAGLWGLRLYFTTESPRECVDMMRSYKYGDGIRPNNSGRGLSEGGAL